MSGKRAKITRDNSLIEPNPANRTFSRGKNDTERCIAVSASALRALLDFQSERQQR